MQAMKSPAIEAKMPKLTLNSVEISARGSVEAEGELVDHPPSLL